MTTGHVEQDVNEANFGGRIGVRSADVQGLDVLEDDHQVLASGRKAGRKDKVAFGDFNEDVGRDAG